MTQAERSVGAPNEVTAEMDRRVMAYLLGHSSLASAVAVCVTALGPRPVLSISIAHADAAMQARLQALQSALVAPELGIG